MNIKKFEKQLQINFTSNKTIKTYIDQVGPFLKYCDGDITQEKIDNYMINKREKIKTSSCNVFINALKKYCEFANFNYKIPKQKSIKTRYKYSWTLNEFEKNILPYFYNEQDVILRVMFFTGLRPHELWGLKIEAIDFKKEIFIINGKGDKDRIIPFLDGKTIKKLKEYIGKRNKGSVFDLNKQKLTYLFKTIKEKLSIKEDISPYTMRRSFACYCDDQGMSLKKLKQLMGHTDIKTTERYISENPTSLINACKKIRRN